MRWPKPLCKHGQVITHIGGEECHKCSAEVQEVLRNQMDNQTPKAKQRYLVWSYDHQSWWGEIEKQYTTDPRKAKSFSKDETEEITSRWLIWIMGMPAVKGVSDECYIPEKCVREVEESDE